ncbi:MAG: S9 family peptidase [Candidatus Brocadiae bacterium]|nr:S9 family peptidase [Candidatus Brocadiia bacterium]
MKKNCLLFLWVLLSMAVLFLSGQDTNPVAPIAEKIPFKMTAHEQNRIDEYYWMRDRENPKVIEYLKAENAYTEAVLKDTKELQETLFQEIIGRIKQTDSSVPYRLRGYFYYTRYEEGKEYPVYCRKLDAQDAREEVLLDVNKMSEGYNYYQIVGFSISPDNQMLAFGEDTVGRRKYTLCFKDLASGKILPDRIANTTGRAIWANDNKTVFYSIQDETLRSYKVLRYLLNSKPVEVFHEKDDTFFTFVTKTKSGRFILIGSSSTVSTEYRFLDASLPEGDFKVFQPRERDLEYSIEHYKEDFYICTNQNAKNFKLMKAPLGKTEKENWVDVIPHREQVLLENFRIFSKYLVLEERENGLNQIRIMAWDNSCDYRIDFGEACYTAYAAANAEFDTEILRYVFDSMVTPPSVFDFNMKDKTKKLMKQEEIVGGYVPDNYHSERLYAVASDKTWIPISMVYKKSEKKQDGNPLLLYGYGSYGYSTDPGFSSSLLSLLDRGIIFAIAHIRGGEEMGRSWYEDGKLLKKRNTFTDFIACAEHLVEKKYTKSNIMFASGGSAGGLLVGAVVNMRPDLFKGVIAAVPFVDVVTTMLDDTIPLTTAEYDEWGNPNIKEYYDYILSYSPYDNVKAQQYPAMLVTSGLHDSQVQYWEPTKWVAKLRSLKTDSNPLLLYTDMEAGHSGATGRFKSHRETALQYAFLLKLLQK